MLSVGISDLVSSLYKSSVSLANVTAKQHFLQVCLDNGVLPKGFKLKFTLQTGLLDDAADVMVKNILDDASLKLLAATIKAEDLKADTLRKRIMDLSKNLDPGERSSCINLATAKFKKVLILRTRIHRKKLRKLTDSALSIIVDLDDVVLNFETNIVGFMPISPIQSTFDWFDERDFPPLEASIRRDWTLEIIDV